MAERNMGEEQGSMETKEKLIIRQAKGADAGQIAEVEKACFSTPWSYESLKHDMTENKLALYMAAETGGKICGYAALWKIIDEGHITNVAVFPAYRRRGIARAVLSALIEEASKQGIKRFTLEVRTGNEAAKKLYARLGFLEAGLRKGYYEDNGEDALIMWKEE